MDLNMSNSVKVKCSLSISFNLYRPPKTLSKAYSDTVLFPFSSKDLKYFSTSDLV
jgi:hypothetical protein